MSWDTKVYVERKYMYMWKKIEINYFETQEVIQNISIINFPNMSLIRQKNKSELLQQFFLILLLSFDDTLNKTIFGTNKILIVKYTLNKTISNKKKTRMRK